MQHNQEQVCTDNLAMQDKVEMHQTDFKMGVLALERHLTCCVLPAAAAFL